MKLDSAKPRILQGATVARTLETFIVPIAAPFREKGWRVDGAARGVTERRRCIAGFEKVLEVKWSRNPWSASSIIRGSRTLRAIVQRERYDLVHVHTPVAGFIARYALRKTRGKEGPKVVYTAHGFHFHRDGKPLKNHLFRCLEKAAGRWTDYLVVINQDDLKAAQKYRLVPDCRVRLIPGVGIDADAYKSELGREESVRRLRRELGLEAKDALILMVAEFNPEKRHRDALRAFAKSRSTDAHLAFAGDGRLVRVVRGIARRLGVERRVHFLGFRGDIPVVLQAAMAAILPSEREGLPRSIMECFAAGVPVIGSNVRGIKDLLRGGRGLLVPLGDVEALAKAMDWILVRREEAAAIARRAREHVKKFETMRIVEMHEALYKEALGRE